MIKLFTDAQAQLGRRYPIEYLLRSACLIAADTILQAMRQFLSPFPDELIISGGGVENQTLMSLLRQPLGDLSIRTTDELAIVSQSKEAVAFALLGAATIDGIPGNVPAATVRAAASCSVPLLRNHRLSMEMNDRSNLLTERRLAASMNLDVMPVDQAVALMSEQDAVAVAAVAAERNNIVRAIELVVAGLKAGGRLIYVGAGTSGRLGVIDASECPPTFSTDPEMVQGILAGGNEAMFKSKEGAEDDEREGAAVINKKNVGLYDIVMGIAAGGTTPFVRGALDQARRRGAKTVFFCCVQPGPNQATADVTIRPLTGPEVLTGSTRLKAGTATKLVLNQITTIAMVQLGKVHQNLMVDLCPSNAKLRQRAAHLVATLTGLDRDQSLKLLESAGDVKTAVTMHLQKVNPAQARQILSENNGRLPRG